jgi:sec-independent protein translocase protein TatC
MAQPGEEERLESDLETDDEGGPVKPFLEHLEDLRWVLIKGVVAVALGMLLCLIGANFVLNFLRWPLEKADSLRENRGQDVAFFVGTNMWGKFKPGVTNMGVLNFGTNDVAAFELVAVTVGSNQVLALQPVTNQTLIRFASARKQLLITLGPAAGFWVAFQVAMYGGIVLATPYLIFIIGQFVIPALKLKEKKYVMRGFIIGTALFLSGVAFCYFALMPVALRASYGYSEWLGFSADQWRAEDYISFVCKFMLGMGLGFELPVVLLVLVKIGVLTYGRLRAMRRYMIVINLILGAVLTTPEVVTQILMFIPLQLLYELSVWVAGYWEKDERERRQAKIVLIVSLLLLAGLITAAIIYREQVTLWLHQAASH